MTINEIREQIAMSLDKHCHQIWWTILDDTTPGHYGVEGLEVQVAITDIWVNVPKKTFTFRNAELSFSAQLVSSNVNDSIVTRCRKVVSGTGTFDFGTATRVEVTRFQINEEIDLFEHVLV